MITASEVSKKPGAVQDASDFRARGAAIVRMTAPSVTKRR